MKIVRSAVIGTGFIGPAHVEALRRIEGVKVTAVVDTSKEKAQKISGRFEIPNAYSDWRRLLDDPEVEVVHNCTPNYLHYEINKALILAGKHVVSEKPLAMRTNESAELVKLAADNKICNAVNFNYRFYPLIQHARSLTLGGELGDVLLVHGHYLQDWLYYDTDYNWRLEPELGGESRAVADVGSHWCDMVQFVTGSKITRVFANLTTIHKVRYRPLEEVATFKGKEETGDVESERINVGTEDAGSVLIEFENGATGVFTVSQVSAGRKNRFWFEIDGSKKALSWNQEEPDKLWLGYREKPNEIVIKDPALMDLATRKYAHYPGGHPEGYDVGLRNMVMNFYDFVRSGKDPAKDETEFPTFLDGHLEMRIAEAALRSNAEKVWVDV